ncbi:MAG: single-stranded DNA-binding protein [Clostridia bacterium]|nr:single-stranded DNA-binding protein [Clostridia bacterium]
MASLNLNKVVLAGHLTATPELRQTPNGVSVTTFSIAVNRRVGKSADGQPAQQTVDFFNLVAWRSVADFVTRYFRKGSAICVTGSIQNRSWTDQQGNKRYATEIIVDEAFFVDNSSAGSTNIGGDAFGAQAPAFATPVNNAPSTANTVTETVQFDSDSNDDDLPF